MGAMFTLLLSKLSSIVAWFAALAIAVFAALWLLGTDLGSWIFDQVLQIATSVLNSISINQSLFDPSPYLSALPDPIVNMIGLLHLGDCLAIIAGAVILKITLQLVPFTRLGS